MNEKLYENRIASAKAHGGLSGLLGLVLGASFLVDNHFGYSLATFGITLVNQIWYEYDINLSRRFLENAN